MNIDFKWARRQWIDPTTGIEMACISPDRGMHFRNAYFRSRMFNADGTRAVLLGQDPANKCPPSLWHIDLLSGDHERIFEFSNRGGLSSWAFSPVSPNLLNVVDRVDGYATVVQIDFAAETRRTIKPTIPLRSIDFPESTADDRYLFAPVSQKQISHGISESLRIAMMGSQPGHNLMFRVSLDDGATDVVFETDEWWMGHSNPNPRNPHLAMFCQEGFIWTEEFQRPANFQRQRIYDFEQADWFDLQGDLQSRGTHEHWSACGTRVYSHDTSYGCPAIYKIDLRTKRSSRYLGLPDYGLSMHVRCSPDQSFLIGDGFNYCKADRGSIGAFEPEQLANSPWALDGIDTESPAETIWLYELPSETIWSEDREFDSWMQAHDAIKGNPDRIIRTRPLCRFHSLSKANRVLMRLESNAQVTPDSRWAIFQSVGDSSLFEVWAAKIPSKRDDA